MAEEIKKDFEEAPEPAEETEAVIETEEEEAWEEALDEEAQEEASGEPAEESAEAGMDAEKSEAAEDKAAAKSEGFFKKKKKDKEKWEEQIAELQDKVKRQMAEFENFRKRSDKEKNQMFDMGARSIIEKFLPVVDNFERGLAAVPEEQREDAFVTGMDKVYKQMLTELENVGVKPIEAVGCEFNPELHNAVMQVENDELESGTVAQELQKGYTYKDAVVRHSMVSVVS